MSGGVLTRPCESCGGPHFTRDHADAVAVERRYESADLPGCSWCRECGSCDYGLAMSCTCGDCTCAERCGHPRCARGWTPPGEPVCTTCGGRGYLLTASGEDGDLIDQEPCPDCPPPPPEHPAGADPRPVACYECGVALSESAAELGPWCSEACRQGESNGW